MKPLFVFAMFLALAAAARADTIALGDGESLRFRVGWGLFPNAGEITVNARAEEIEGLPNTRVTTLLATRGLVRSLYTLEARGDCLFDAHDGRLLSATSVSTAGKKRTHTMAVFNYGDASLRYEDFLRPERSAVLAIPKNDTMDLITCLVQARAWDLKIGDSRQVTAMFEDDFYDLTVTAVGNEKVKSPWGEVDTLILEPAPTPGAPVLGMFKKGAKVRVWISQDERRLPVKFQLGLKYGTGTAYLTNYTPPNPPPTSAAVANSGTAAPATSTGNVNN